jgi:hypothetical protein
VWAVVGGIHHAGVVRYAQVVQRLEDRADISVVVDHGVVVRALPTPGLADALRLGMGAEMHVGEIHPDEYGFAGLVLSLNEVHGPVLAISSSIVSMRFFVSGPVSLQTCLPTLPKRGSTV